MRLVDIEEAKMSLAALVDAVRGPARDQAKAAAAGARIREIGAGLTLGPGLTIRELIDEGRKD